MPWDRELLEAALIGFERSESGSAGAHRRGSEQIGDRVPAKTATDAAAAPPQRRTWSAAACMAAAQRKRRAAERELQRAAETSVTAKAPAGPRRRS
jgi:hypothetical protein